MVGLCLGAAAVHAQPVVGHAQPVVGDVSVSTQNGFARLVFRFGTPVTATARLANNIIVVNFDAPIFISVDRLNASAPDYISAARLDPDGKAVRIALAQQLTANLLPANERIFLDLLPVSWTGLPPGLPQEVVEELSRRTREAERRARTQQQLARRKKVEPIRVSVGKQPTFTRYTIPLSSVVAVASDRGQHGLTLVFDTALRFDLADTLIAPPPFVASVEAKLDEDASSLHFAFNGKVDVRTFREDNNYVVDVSATEMSRPDVDPVMKVIEELRAKPDAGRTPASAMTPPQTMPAARPPHLRLCRKRRANMAPPAMPAPAARPERAAASAAPSSPSPSLSPSPGGGNAPGDQAKPGTTPSPSVRSETEEKKAATVNAEVRRSEKVWRITFPFATPTPAAVFRRADVMWLVFDTETAINVDALRSQPNGMIRRVATSYADGQVIRLKLDRPRLSALTMEGNGWTVTLGDSVDNPSIPVSLNRTVARPSRAGIAIPFDGANRLHRISDPDVGDVLLVVSALGRPARGILKPYEFVELNALASTHGIAVQPLADDVIVQVAPDRVVIGRPDGLTLSAQGAGGNKVRGSHALFDIEQWTRDRTGNFTAEQLQYIDAAVDAPADQKSTVYRKLARLYMAREMFHEAKGALDMALSQEHVKGERPACTPCAPSPS